MGWMDYLASQQAGDNQFGNFGAGVVPQQPGGSFLSAGYNGAGGSGGINKQGKSGYSTVNPMFPTLTQGFGDFLNGQIGRGATPFNLSSFLPSSGGTTAPGSLSAPLNPILAALAAYYGGGQSNIPGSASLTDMANTGSPISAIPAWQAGVDAMQRNIAQNAANLKEQFAFSGNLSSTPFGNAMTDFYTQTSKDQNATLASAQQQALEAAQGRKLAASEFINSGSQSLGQMLQGLDQSSIDSMLQEFIRTRPEYSPYLNMLFGAATTFPPTVKTQTGTGTAGGVLGSLGALLGLIPGIGPAVGTIAGLVGGGVGHAASAAGGGSNQPSINI